MFLSYYHHWPKYRMGFLHTILSTHQRNKVWKSQASILFQMFSFCKNSVAIDQERSKNYTHILYVELLVCCTSSGGWLVHLHTVGALLKNVILSTQI